MIDMLVIVRALPEADIVDDELQIAVHRFTDGLQGFEFTVDMLVDDDLLHSHILILKGFPHRVHTGGGGDLHLEARKTLPDEIDEVRDADGNSIRSGPIDPFEKLDQFSITFSGILKVSKTGGIEEITEFQSSLMASLDISVYKFSVDLRKDITGSCSPHRIVGKFAKEGVDGGALQGVKR